MTITIEEVCGDELACERRGERLPAHVYLDCRTGKLGAEYDPDPSGSPSAVWHGHVRRWRIPAFVEGAANRLLASLAPLAERAVDGYDSEWDGHNHVAQFSSDARAALEDIAAAVDDVAWDPDPTSVVPDLTDAWDWYMPLGGARAIAGQVGITATTTDDEIAAMVDDEVALARDQGYRLDPHDVVRFLKERVRDELPRPAAVVEDEDAEE